jgi:hypothetical protein
VTDSSDRCFCGARDDAHRKMHATRHGGDEPGQRLRV